jgi:hypothetical protein
MSLAGPRNWAKLTGMWLTTTPTRLNGTELSADKFRDSLRLRLGLTPLALPASCDGCGQPFTVGHALTCKKGGLVVLRNNDVSAEWHHLCAQALSPAAVSDEPLIHPGRDGTADGRAPGADYQPEIHGDVGAHGFCRRGVTAIFDIQITDTNAPSYRGLRVLARHEKEKKDNSPGAGTSLHLCFLLMGCEAVRRRPHPSVLHRAYWQKGSGRTRKFAGSSAPASQSR